MTWKELIRTGVEIMCSQRLDKISANVTSSPTTYKNPMNPWRRVTTVDANHKITRARHGEQPRLIKSNRGNSKWVWWRRLVKGLKRVK